MVYPGCSSSLYIFPIPSVKSSGSKLAVLAAFVAIIVFVALALKATNLRPTTPDTSTVHSAAPRRFPLPFAPDAQVDLDKGVVEGMDNGNLKGTVTPLGVNSKGITVYLVRQPHENARGDTQKQNIIYIWDVQSTVQNVPINSVLNNALGKDGKDISAFMYKYSPDAVQEIAGVGHPFGEQWILTNFAWTPKYANEDVVQGQNWGHNFATAHGLTWNSTDGASTLHFSGPSLWVAVVNETDVSDTRVNFDPGAKCGNAWMETGETCDDGNIAPGDGCSASCTPETGWTCTNNPSVCTSNGPVISDVSATPSDTSAVITWTTDLGASSQVEYGTTTSYGSTTTNDTNPVTSHSVTIASGLAAMTTYHYRVKSTASGTTTTSPDATFTTATIIPPPMITNVTCTPSDTTALITWDTDKMSDSQVEYGPTAAYGSTTTVDPATVASHSVTVSGLSASTTYHYRAKSTADGKTGTSSDATCATLPPIPF